MMTDLIGYEEISLKNMIGNKRKIALGEYKGYMIRNTHIKIKSVVVFDNTSND